MEVTEFQSRLEQLCQTAGKAGNPLTQEQLREAFDGLKLERDQLLKILKYLKAQGIEIEGTDEPENAAAPVGAEIPTPLTPQEKAYLQEYLADIAKEPAAVNADSLPSLFKRLSQGDDLAMARLTQKYLPVAAEMAAEMNCPEIALPDLIQEANVGLLTALSEPEPALKNDLWLRSEIRRSIAEAIEEQSQQKFRDDCLVARVEKLEAAVRDLTDEDGENRFSIDELAVILDMTTDEIRDILKLTGDDK